MNPENAPERSYEAHNEYYEQAYHDRLVLYLATMITDIEIEVGLEAGEDTIRRIITSEIDKLEQLGASSKPERSQIYEHFFKRFKDIS